MIHPVPIPALSGPPHWGGNLLQNLGAEKRQRGQGEYRRPGGRFRRESCHILQGVVELTENGKEPVIYRAGDSFAMKPGYVGVWKTIETVRKIYVTVT
ncbi:putative cupin superfamily protein [Sinorhizobium fredii]